MTWSATPETKDVAEGLIGFARGYAEQRIAQLSNVHFVLTSLTGVQNNAKRKGGPGSSATEVRPGIGFVIAYSPSSATNESTILDGFNRLGLTNTPYEPVVKGVPNKLQEGDGVESLVAQCCTVLKDHNSKYVVDLLTNTIAYSTATYPDFPICKKPVNLCIVNPAFRARLAHSYDQLRYAGISIDICNIEGADGLAAYRTSAAKGVDKAMDDLLDFMKQQDLAVRKGQIYAKATGAVVTYVPVYSAETFVYRALANPLMRGKISLALVKPLAAHLGHPAFSIIPQLEIDLDLIEVNNGKCWDLAQLKYIDTPIEPEMIGRRTPRAFHPMAPTVPVPMSFIETVNNSFPTPADRGHFLLKWYQLVFWHRHLMKTRCLMVHGVKDCGKSTIINPIMTIIPTQHHASITCEKNAFATSMIKEHTQIVFVDEFHEGKLDASTAKGVLQGGYTTTVSKHKTGEIFNSQAMFYFTAQHEPNWGVEDGNVKRRLTIFEMRPLPTVMHNVSQWLKDNAVPCIIWAGCMVRRSLDTLPLTPTEKRNELFFLYENQPVPRNSALIQRVQNNFVAAPIAEVTEEEAERVYEMFNNQELQNRTPLTPPSSPSILAGLADSSGSDTDSS